MSVCLCRSVILDYKAHYVSMCVQKKQTNKQTNKTNKKQNKTKQDITKLD